MWVRSVRDAETDSSDSNEASEEKISALLSIAMASVSVEPENRPEMGDVVRMIREARVEAHLSSNGSDHSPGRWSDTVHSMRREEQLTM